MIEVSVREDGITISGHAGYAEPGKDIICAGATALTETLVKSLEDLTEEPFIVSNRENYPELFDFRIRYCMERGIRPENIRYARNVKDVMVMVSRGEGVAVLNEDGQIDTIGTIHAIPLADAVPPVHLVFVWKKKKQSSCIGKFVEILREVQREG